MEHDFIGRGWSFPPRPAAGRLPLVGGEQRIRQSLWILLGTAPGERAMLPDFGCGIHDLVFEPNTAALRGLLRERVLEALVRFEPRIEVLDVRVDTPGARHCLNIAIDYRIRAHNARHNLVYPFFLTEGAG